MILPQASPQIPTPHDDPGIPWTIADIWLGIGYMILWLAGEAVIAFLLQRMDRMQDLGIFAGLIELLLLLPVAILLGFKYHRGLDALGFRRPSVSALIVGFGLMCLIFCFNLIYGLILAQFDLRVQEDIVPILETDATPWLLIGAGVFIAPFVEEIFFRGFLFAGLRKKLGWVPAALISSGLFALLHIEPTAFPPIFILGFLFAYLYHYSSSLWPSIFLHFLTNALSFGAAYALILLGKTG